MVIVLAVVGGIIASLFIAVKLGAGERLGAWIDKHNDGPVKERDYHSNVDNSYDGD